MNSDHRFKVEHKLYESNLTSPLVKSLLAFFSLIVLALIFLPWQQTSKASGRVLAFSPNDRPQNIESPVEGKVIKWYVTEGSVIKENDPIVEIADLDPQFVENLERQRQAILKRLQAISANIQVTKINMDRQKQLFEKGLSARKDYEKASVDLMSLIATEASISAELTQLDIKLSRQSNQLIRSPRAGIISSIKIAQGLEILKQGDLIAVVVPHTKQRSVELYVQGQDLPLLSVGRHVRLQFEGWPAVQFSGWPSIAIGTFGGEVAVIDPVGTPEGTFRILVLPEKVSDWPDETYLRQGIRVYGWILLDQVKLGFELWRQLNGFPPTISQK